MPNYTWNTITSDHDTISKLLNENGEFSFNYFIEMPDDLKRTISGGRIGECICYYLLKTNKWSDAKNKINKLHISHNYNYCKRKTKKETMEELNKLIGNNPTMFSDETHYERRKDKNGKECTFVVKEDYGHTAEEIGEHYYNLFEKYGCCDWYSWANRNWGTKWDAFDTYIGDDYISFTTAWCTPEPILYKICEKFPYANISFTHEYEDGYYTEASNNDGNYIIDSEWEREYSDEDDYDGYWVNTETGEKKGA